MAGEHKTGPRRGVCLRTVRGRQSEGFFFNMVARDFTRDSLYARLIPNLDSCISIDRAYVLHTTCMTSMAASRPESKDLSDAFIKISFQEDRESDPLMGHWLDQGLHPSTKHGGPTLIIRRLRQTLLTSRAPVRHRIGTRHLVLTVSLVQVSATSETIPWLLPGSDAGLALEFAVLPLCKCRTNLTT